MAKWAVGLRLPGATDASVEKAFNEGLILRTHVLRPTWHFVAPADIRWMLALTAPRVRAAMGFVDRQFEVNRALLKRCHAIFAKVLAGGNALTRTELSEVLRKGKIAADGPRLGNVLIHAELNGLICSGPRRGKQFTYALLDERVPAAKTLGRDAALAELARRYFSSRGPATVQDFSWWSGLTVKDARAGAATLGDGFNHETVDGRTYLFPSSPPALHESAEANFLLPIFDEYGIAYKDRRALLRSNAGGRTDHAEKVDVTYSRTIVFDKRIAGSWRRMETKTGIVIEAALFGRMNRSEKIELTAAVRRYGAFVGKTARVVHDR